MSLGKVIFPETKQQKVFEPKSNFPTNVYNAIALLLMLELMLVIRPLWILGGDTVQTTTTRSSYQVKLKTWIKAM